MEPHLNASTSAVNDCPAFDYQTSQAKYQLNKHNHPDAKNMDKENLLINETIVKFKPFQNQ